MKGSKYDWNEANANEFGSDYNEILAEFQALGLKSKGSSAIYQDGLKVGTKLKYLCGIDGCSFAARIVKEAGDDKAPFVEIASKAALLILSYFLDLHNHEVRKNHFCPKKLAEAIAREPDKKPKQILKAMRRVHPAEDGFRVEKEEAEEEEKKESEIIAGKKKVQIKTDSQLLQSLRNQKSKLNMQGQILSVDDLEKFCRENLRTGQNENEVFVCDWMIGSGDNPTICVVFSSKTCMKFLHAALSTPSPMLAIDGTFKVNSLGHPLICLTTQDLSHQIYPIAMAPSSTESEETITFVMKAVMKTYKSIYKKEVKPKFFMSDCAQYIFNSLSTTIPSACHLSCFFHIKEAQRKRALADSKVDKSDRTAILAEIQLMQTFFTKKHFEKYWDLFKEKYSQYSDYLKYFEDHYITSRNNKWHFYDVEPNIFLTNNISESLNASIKRDITNRERKPLHLFYDDLKLALIDLSKQQKIFRAFIPITSDMKIKATNLDRKNLLITRRGYYFWNKNEEEKPDFDVIDRYLDCDYEDIEDFKQDHQNLITLKWDNTKKKGICFCPYGYKNGKCHHRLALEMHRGTLARTIMLGRQKRRGRKKKAAPALEVQSDSDDDEVPQQPPRKAIKGNRR